MLIIVSLSLLAAVFLYLGFSFLANSLSGWLAFLRISLGALCLLVVSATAALIWDFTQYREAGLGEVLATVQFVEVGDQVYATEVETTDGSNMRFILEGDVWQIEALALIKTGEPSYSAEQRSYQRVLRLESIRGRHYGFEHRDRNNKTRLVRNNIRLQLVQVLNSAPLLGQWFNIDTLRYSADYLPFSDGARYQISLTADGLGVIADNSVAQYALNEW